MNTSIVEVTKKNLKKLSLAITLLEASIYRDTSPVTFGSSIGENVRHILSFYENILVGVINNGINLSIRRPNPGIENDPLLAIDKIEFLIHSLDRVNTDLKKETLTFIDDIGSGPRTFTGTLESLLWAANFHQTHHEASICHLFTELGLPLSMIPKGFGYNPTTCKKK